MKRLVLFLSLAVVSVACCKKNSGQLPLSAIVENALQAAEKQALLMAEKYAPQQGLLPRSFENGRDVSSDSRWWCSGFFPGVLWYLYENSGDSTTLSYARLFTDRVEREKYTVDNHDVGFMLYSSFGNGLRLTEDPRYAEILQTGAGSLSTRFRPEVGLIRSWNHNQDRWQYPVIIDNMMNLELLMWAAEHTDDSQNFRNIAISHADSTMINHFRDDGSSYHVVSYDTLSGRPQLRETHQGYSDASAWSRGQAWGLYGYTMMYRETGCERYLAHAQRIAEFMINHPNMPVDGIPYWDFDAPDIPNSTRDASAAAIMASALVELAGFSTPELAAEYMGMAETQVRTLASPEYTAPEGDNGGFILMHSTGAYPFGSEMDVPLTYADYYYVEVLTRLKISYDCIAKIDDSCAAALRSVAGHGSNTGFRRAGC